MQHFTVLTEEIPNIDEIRVMMKMISHDIPYSTTNSDIIPNIVHDDNGMIFKGEWCLKYDIFVITIKLFKGNTSCIDYMLFDSEYNLENGDASGALVILESTKTCDNVSRNTAVYQRLAKFTTYDNMYPKSNAIKVMFWCNNDWKKSLTHTAEVGMRLMDTLNINMYAYSNGSIINLKDKYQIKPFETVDDVIVSKNNANQKKGNESIRIYRESNIINIAIKLDKGVSKHSGIISHDPNVGFLSAILNTFEKITNKPYHNKYIIHNHGIDQEYFDKCPKSKLWYSTNNINIEFNDRIIKDRPKIPCSYFTLENQMTEKLATILYDMVSENKTIFSNHGGCALTYIKGNGCHDNVGQKMPRPDIVFENKEKNELIVVEGKLEKELLKGIKQLSDTHLEGFVAKLKKMYPNHVIKKGLCIAMKDIKDIDKFKNLEFPVIFALDSYGYFINLS